MSKFILRVVTSGDEETELALLCPVCKEVYFTCKYALQNDRGCLLGYTSTMMCHECGENGLIVPVYFNSLQEIEDFQKNNICASEDFVFISPNVISLTCINSEKYCIEYNQKLQ